MSPHKIVFLGTPDIAVPCLERLLGSPDFDVVGVISQPDKPAGRNLRVQSSPVKKLAESRGVEVFTPESARSPEVIKWVREREPVSAVVVAYGQILSTEFLSLFSLNAVNIHASVLPRWRGAAPIQRAILAGDRVSGVALQVVVPRLDAGPILGLREISIDDQTTSYDLYMQLRSMAPELLSDEYVRHLKGELKAQPQDESRVTVAPKILKAEGLIDWNKSALEISQQIRGLWMWPGSWTLRAGKTLKVWTSSVSERSSNRSGEVLEVRAESVMVGCGKGALEIFEVQPESRGKMPVSEYLKGYPLKVGEKFG